MRLVRRATLLGILMALFLQGNAFAATVNVSAVEFSFTPSLAKVKMGDTIHWTNNGTVVHTSTQDTPLGLWDSGTLNPGASFDFLLYAAGIYNYHCSFHQAQGMVASAGAKPTARPPNGPVGTMFTITVASIDAPAGFVYDVQKKDPGGSFTDWKLGITTKTTTFDSTGQPTGKYSFRSRLHRLSNNGVSGYSPAANITVT